MGAVALANITPVGGGAGRRAVQADVTFSSSYATGGDTINLGLLGLQHVYEVWELQGRFSDSPITVAVSYTPSLHGLQGILAGTVSAPKLKAIAGTVGAGAEVTNATNLSALPALHLEFRGV